MSDEHDEPVGMGLPLPEGMIKALMERHEREHMQVDATAARVENFLDALNADDLVTLRYILNAGDGGRSCANNYTDGQIVTILRLKHHADPWGEPLMGALLKEDSTSEGTPE